MHAHKELEWTANISIAHEWILNPALGQPIEHIKIRLGDIWHMHARTERAGVQSQYLHCP